MVVVVGVVVVVVVVVVVGVVVVSKYGKLLISESSGRASSGLGSSVTWAPNPTPPMPCRAITHDVVLRAGRCSTHHSPREHLSPDLLDLPCSEV